jgi:outer membrane immunogenic protein
MLKTFAAAAAILIGVAGSANAADLYSTGGYKGEPAYASPLWGGWYLGGFVGGAWSRVGIDDVTTTTSFSNEETVFIGGAQFGFNYQRGGLVIGPEVDLGGIGLGHKALGPTATSSTSSGFFGDITGRLGYAVGPALIYVKGGYVYVDGDVTVAEGAASSYKASGFSGYTVGGGLEYKVSPAWSLKGEYQYLDLSSFSTVLPGSGDTYNSSFDIHTAKVGLNYHFASGYAPLK